MSGDGADAAENARTGYNEVCRAYERIDDFRAKLLGFLPAVSGIGLFFLFDRAGPGGTLQHDRQLLTLAGSFGAVITLGLLLYEERGIQYCIRLTTVGKKLESEIGVCGRFTQWPHSVGRLINEPTASGLIYSSVLASWVFVAIMSTSNLAAGVAAAAVGLTCLFATRGFYWWVTWGEEIAREGHPTRDTWSYRHYASLVTRRIITDWRRYANDWPEPQPRDGLDRARQDATLPKGDRVVDGSYAHSVPAESQPRGTANNDHNYAYAKWLYVKFGRRQLSRVTLDVLSGNLNCKGGEMRMLCSAWDISGGEHMIRENLLKIAFTLVQVNTEKGCSVDGRTQKLLDWLKAVAPSTTQGP